MNYTDYLNEINTYKNDKEIISKRNFNKFFEILEAGDDGNCLFYSIEQLHPKYDFRELREQLCEYYKTFHVNDEYPEDSLHAKLQMQMMIDNEEEEDGTLHEENICKNGEWASIMDVIALTDILKTNIILFNMTKGGYTIQPFIYKKTAKTIFIKYNGINHFEPLIPKFDVKTPSMSSPKSYSKSIGKSNQLSKAESVSSETRRLIDELDKAKGVSKKHKNNKRRTRKNKE